MSNVPCLTRVFAAISCARSKPANREMGRDSPFMSPALKPPPRAENPPPSVPVQFSYPPSPHPQFCSFLHRQSWGKKKPTMPNQSRVPLFSKQTSWLRFCFAALCQTAAPQAAIQQMKPAPHGGARWGGRTPPAAAQWEPGDCHQHLAILLKLQSAWDDPLETDCLSPQMQRCKLCPVMQKQRSLKSWQCPISTWVSLCPRCRCVSLSPTASENPERAFVSTCQASPLRQALHASDFSAGREPGAGKLPSSPPWLYGKRRRPGPRSETCLPALVTGEGPCRLEEGGGEWE
ncbi:hypothetical protein E2320_001281 [Naja naja]|nr:hypothetical protein E2320_001281 [Naja naja]